MSAIQPKTLSLKELQTLIKQAVEAMPDTYWVAAEINELRETTAGHCFLELVQKADHDERLEAKASTVIWASVYRMLKAYFVAETHMSLAVGMKVLVRVAVQYHELYGLRLNVVDLDATYTLGEMAMQRRQTVEQLQSDGVYDMNRELELPLLPQRVAVISSEQAAGYGDFMRQLHNNSGGYAFRTVLFSAAMQGAEAEPTIVAALEQICLRADDFDLVAILRGGGSQSDLACFDSYRLAGNVAQFPLPIITGIGHDRDVSVVDEVAHTMLKTPTAAAEFLVEKMAEQEAHIGELWEQLSNAWGAILQDYERKRQQLLFALKSGTQRRLQAEKTAVERYLPQHIKQGVNHKISGEKTLVAKLESELRLVNPQSILRRGYTITRSNGKILRSAANAQSGAVIETVMWDGMLESRVV
jgi:exodeoxyribonuclease VII large subunit